MTFSLQYYGRTVCADCNLPSHDDEGHYIALGERGSFDCLDAPEFIPAGGHHRVWVDQRAYAFGAELFTTRE